MQTNTAKIYSRPKETSKQFKISTMTLHRLSSHLDLCINHKQEWKHSHFAEHNCDYCKALEVIKALTQRLEMIDLLQGSDTEHPWVKRGKKILKENGIET